MLQSCAVYGGCASKGSGPKETVLTSCSTKATLAGVVSIVKRMLWVVFHVYGSSHCHAKGDKVDRPSL